MHRTDTHELAARFHSIPLIETHLGRTLTEAEQEQVIGAWEQHREHTEAARLEGHQGTKARKLPVIPL